MNPNFLSLLNHFSIGPLYIKGSLSQKHYFINLIAEECRRGNITEQQRTFMWNGIAHEYVSASNHIPGYIDKEGCFHFEGYDVVEGKSVWREFHGRLAPRTPSDTNHEPYCVGDQTVSLTPVLTEERKAYSLQGMKDNPDVNYLDLDTPEPWGLFFQDNATPQMEGIEELHNNIMFYLAIILFSVTWILLSIILNYSKSRISNKYLNHGTLVELIWTITPALILILIAFPSFKLLYLMDEVIDPSLVIYGEGHQWYWSYQYPDFTNNDDEFVEFDSYIVPESDLEKGKLRMLEVDNRVIIPELTHTRFVVAAADVIHSYACPSLGIKCDAYPGRLNQSSVYLNREGTYFGQCSEICGILHSSMPISIQSVKLGKFLFWLYDQIGG
jgi:cytochrome c oxidase subunit 2